MKSDVKRKGSPIVLNGSCCDGGTTGRLFFIGEKISDANAYIFDLGSKHPRKKQCFWCFLAHWAPEATSLNSLSKLSFYFNMKVLI